MNNVPRTTVYDFIYNTVAGIQKISVKGAHGQYIKIPFYEGTPNDLFRNDVEIANKFKNWQVDTIWADGRGVLVITCEGGRDPEWLSDYGKDPQGWLEGKYDREMEKTYGPDWYLRDDI